ncbi:helicase-related protein [Proteocatella sphenisci]|uniref:helicase-related protein n=1 Tax=Proteocatella sphenisci TaxID=181070 RepID=UPI00048B7921|nr:helicase-related protein [Proteocatella sphenisci]
MTHNDLTFFTNEPDRNLYERFGNILKSNTQYFDVLVGYFRTSGFFRMYPAMEKLDKIRILVGLNVDNRTVEIIKQAEQEFVAKSLSQKEAKEAYSESIEKEFTSSDDTMDVEKGVRTFIEWLNNGKLEVKMYTESPIHAKVYIMRKNMALIPDMYGSVITGSSNFSEAGLKNNLEFNVELKDSRDVDFALEKFEELWIKGVDIKESYIETIEGKTWLKSDITPYELYLKTIYEYFKEEINSDKNAAIEKLLPDGYMRLQYQLDAVTQAKKVLDSYGGVFISDVVGLGKTYISALLAKSLKKGHNKLVICPPVLVDYWEEVMKEFDVIADVVSLGKLERIADNPKKLERYDYIFIDEVHRFRNSDTGAYGHLHQICKDKKVILISATPINNYSSDIENQIYLFQQKHNSTIIPNVKNLESFFAKMNTELNKQKKGTAEYKAVLKRNSENIRDQVLRNVMIRRTRKEIIEYYADDLKNQGLKFPKLGAPEKIIYTFDKAVDDVFSETIAAIKTLRYARYTPLLYLKDNKKYASILVSQQNMSGFMKAILVKRLESSFHAFRMTLSRFILSYEKFIKMVKTGDVYVSKKINVYDLLDNGDDAKLMRLVDEEKIYHFKSEALKPTFLPALEYDLAILNQLKEHWDEIKEDPKLDEFVKQLQTDEILKSAKIIVFTESKETAKYLKENLENIYGSRLTYFSGESSEYHKMDVEYSFNPKYEDLNKDKYDILITTDVLAEGINLHRANVLINYDLPWNPTKIMQRGGRINRVGSKHENIYIYNFFPTSQTDIQLPIKDRIISKLQLFHDTLGEDFKYLSDDEEVSSHKLYEELTKNLDEDTESINPELAFLAEIRRVRDNEPELFEKIKKLPLKAKTAKKLSGINADGTITFIRKGALKKFFITTDSTKEISFISAANYIKSDRAEKRYSVERNYFDHLEKNKNAFDDALSQEIEIVADKSGVRGNDSKIIKYLKALQKSKILTDVEDSYIVRMLGLWENGEIPSGISKQIIKDLKNVEDEAEVYNVIMNGVPSAYFAETRQSTKKSREEKQIILSMYLKSEV